MDRKEAKNKFSNELLERALGLKKDKLKIGAVYQIIDEIYDNFESKMCENCRFYDSGYCNNEEIKKWHGVGNKKENVYIDYVYLKNFGCKFFEIKRTNKIK